MWPVEVIALPHTRQLYAFLVFSGATPPEVLAGVAAAASFFRWRHRVVLEGFESSVGPEMEAAVRPEVMAAVGPEMEAAVRPEMAAAIRSEVMAAVGPEAMAVVEPEMEAAVGPEVMAAEELVGPVVEAVKMERDVLPLTRAWPQVSSASGKGWGSLGGGGGDEGRCCAGGRDVEAHGRRDVSCNPRIRVRISSLLMVFLYHLIYRKQIGSISQLSIGST